QLVLGERALEAIAAIGPRLELLDDPGELTDRRVGQAVSGRLRLGPLLDRVATLGLAGALKAREVPLLLLVRPTELHQFRRVGERPVDVDPEELRRIGQPAD